MNKVIPDKKQEKISIQSSSEIVFGLHYPEENPEDDIASISDCLEYIGTFDGLKP